MKTIMKGLKKLIDKYEKMKKKKCLLLYGMRYLLQLANFNICIIKLIRKYTLFTSYKIISFCAD
ncbi:hypothetical protein PFTANZ_00044 [Plasmodium falciparum Tanzania (2000708)]|uniref:Uncharacterized protein n=1 Tax=Plasmodium falciparum Tanzania (2000708) TaxID=1036725 RepID=A0A024WFA4_PLAFA|nr:hypothetical protein PFTANZ_00044 [Plasmodium falciparum Tanzania (2000708)]